MEEKQLNEITKLLKQDNKNVRKNDFLAMLLGHKTADFLIKSYEVENHSNYKVLFHKYLKQIKNINFYHLLKNEDDELIKYLQVFIDEYLFKENEEISKKEKLILFIETFNLCFFYLMWKWLSIANVLKFNNKNKEKIRCLRNFEEDKYFKKLKENLNKLYSLKENEVFGFNLEERQKIILLLLKFLNKNLNELEKMLDFNEEDKSKIFLKLINETSYLNVEDLSFKYFEKLKKEYFLISKDFSFKNFVFFEDFVTLNENSSVLNNNKNVDIFKNTKYMPSSYYFYNETLTNFYGEEYDKNYASTENKGQIIFDINRNLFFKKSSKHYFYQKLLTWFDAKILQKNLFNILNHINKINGKIIFKLNNEEIKKLEFTDTVKWINDSLNEKPYVDYLLSLMMDDKEMQTKEGFLETKSQEKIVINLLVNYFYLNEVRNKNRKKDEIERLTFEKSGYKHENFVISVSKKTSDYVRYYVSNKNHLLYQQYDNIVPENIKTIIKEIFGKKNKNTYFNMRYKITESLYRNNLIEVLSIYCLKNNLTFTLIENGKINDDIELFDLVIYDHFPAKNKYQINEDILKLLDEPKLYNKKIIFIIPDVDFDDEDINKHYLSEIKIKIENKTQYEFYQKQCLEYLILYKHQKDFSQEEINYLVNFFLKMEIYERRTVLRLTSKILLRNKKVFNVNLNELLEEIKVESLPSYIKMEKPKTYLSQVIGLDKEKQIIKTYLDKFKENIKHRQNFDKIGESVKITNKKLAILLEGNSGTGKTMLSKAVANEINLPFLSVSGGTLFESVNKIREVFNQAKRMSPCVLFIDEIDCWGNRLNSKSNEHDIKISCLLNELDNAENNKNVFIIATCNYKNKLDPSLLREGRFNQIIKVKEPSFEQRKEFFKIQFPNFKEHEIESITKKFIGKNFAQIKNITEIYLFQTKEDDINYKNLLEFLDEYYFGKTMDIKITKETAYHEMGHAFLSYILKHGKMELSKVSIIPRESYIGVAQHNYTEDYPLHNRMDYISQIILCLGGICAEKTFCDDLSTGASSDLQMATAIAETMVKSLGLIRLWENLDDLDNFHLPLYKDGGLFGGNDSSEKQKEKIEEEVNYIIRFCLKFTLDLMQKYKTEIDAMANILFEKEELLYSEFKEEMDKLNMKENSEVINFK